MVRGLLVICQKVCVPGQCFLNPGHPRLLRVQIERRKEVCFASRSQNSESILLGEKILLGQSRGSESDIRRQIQT